jgi:putative alpha-1,2-mannosidase
MCEVAARVESVEGETMMKIDTQIRHVSKPSANLFLDLGFSAADAKRMHAASRRQVNNALRRKRARGQKQARGLGVRRLERACLQPARIRHSRRIKLTLTLGS